MKEKLKDVIIRMAQHGHSPDAQAQNLAEFAAIVLKEEFGEDVPAPAEAEPAVDEPQ